MTGRPRRTRVPEPGKKATAENSPQPRVADATVTAMPAPRRQSTADTVKRRPKDRKLQIAKASADAFSESGYHAVSMEEIASRVGISAPALYRHSSSKYELFRNAVLSLGRCLVQATDFVDYDADHDGGSDGPTEAPPATPDETLQALVDALIDTTITYRTAGGLYRWEGRYLNADDQDELADQIKLVNRRLHKPLAALRPTLTSPQRWMLSSAVLSVIGSITDHRSALPTPEIRAILTDLAMSILAADPPAPPARDRPIPSATPVPDAAGTYERLLHESMLLFNERGYRETSMEDIANAVGIQASSIYRYFPGKADILAASFRRAADRISADLSQVLAETTASSAALPALVDAYVSRSFDQPEIAYVYYTERINLPATDEAVLHNIQRATVESWARLLRAARPDITRGHARFAVHAAFALVVDLGRLVKYQNTEHAQASVRHLMEVALLGTPAGRSQPPGPTEESLRPA